ncbi:MAG: energy-coupling factor ABC transporter ATP-binding protein [Desulfovibrionaceae bacterium]|nr:energy-coupling factor ABC transporter ATP-binding protein [Desulfovibrionaceae bacterium]
MSERAIFALDHVSFSYPPDHAVLDNASFGLEAGQHVGLYGPNGSGKTTFFRLALGLVTPDEGQLLFHGKPVRGENDRRALRRAVGLVLQNADDQLFCPTVLDDVAFGPLNLGLTKAQARQRAEQTLAELGLEGFGPRLTHRLSGGEKKLVSLATVLSMRPEALLLDEPTNDLDPEARERLIAVLTSLTTARIIISHDWDFLTRTSESFLTIVAQKLIRAAPPPGRARAHAHNP